MHDITINTGYALKQVSLDAARFEPMTLRSSVWEANTLPSELQCFGVGLTYRDDNSKKNKSFEYGWVSDVRTSLKIVNSKKIKMLFITISLFVMTFDFIGMEKMRSHCVFLPQ